MTVDDRREIFDELMRRLPRIAVDQPTLMDSMGTLRRLLAAASSGTSAEHDERLFRALADPSPSLRPLARGLVSLRMGLSAGLQRQTCLDLALAGVLSLGDVHRLAEERIHRLSGHSLRAEVLSLLQCRGERLNGSGPMGLSGEDLDAPVSILAAACAYVDRLAEGWSGVRVLAYIYGEHALFEEQSALRLLAVLSVYPIGSYVALDSGEKGRVVAARLDDPLRPIVCVRLRADGAVVEPAILYAQEGAPQVTLLLEEPWAGVPGPGETAQAWLRRLHGRLPSWPQGSRPPLPEGLAGDWARPSCAVVRKQEAAGTQPGQLREATLAREAAERQQRRQTARQQRQQQAERRQIARQQRQQQAERQEVERQLAALQADIEQSKAALAALEDAARRREEEGKAALTSSNQEAAAELRRLREDPETSALRLRLAAEQERLESQRKAAIELESQWGAGEAEKIFRSEAVDEGRRNSAAQQERWIADKKALEAAIIEKRRQLEELRGKTLETRARRDQAEAAARRTQAEFEQRAATLLASAQMRLEARRAALQDSLASLKTETALAARQHAEAREAFSARRNTLANDIRRLRAQWGDLSGLLAANTAEETAMRQALTSVLSKLDLRILEAQFALDTACKEASAVSQEQEYRLKEWERAGEELEVLSRQYAELSGQTQPLFEQWRELAGLGLAGVSALFREQLLSRAHELERWSGQMQEVDRRLAASRAALESHLFARCREAGLRAFREGRLDEARSSLRRALSLKADPEAQSLLARLEALPQRAAPPLGKTDEEPYE